MRVKYAELSVYQPINYFNKMCKHVTVGVMTDNNPSRRLFFPVNKSTFIP